MKKERLQLTVILVAAMLWVYALHLVMQPTPEEKLQEVAQEAR